MNDTKIPKFVWSSGDLIIVNPTPEMIKWLRYYHKSMERDPATRKLKSRQELVLLHTVISENPLIISTFQGFVDQLLQLARNKGIEPEFHDRRTWFPDPDMSKAGGFRFNQEELFKQLLAPKRSGLLQAATRYGKCFRAGTKILMYDGKCKAVEDVVVGEQVMGPDSQPRTVTSLARGEELMYEVMPNRGESWFCNKSHILHLQCNYNSYKSYRKGKTVNLTVEEYLQKCNNFKHLFKLRRSGVEFAKRSLPIDPYVLGMWLGDGNSAGPSITNDDKAIQDYLIEWARSVELRVTRNGVRGMTMRFAKTRGDRKLRGNILKIARNMCMLEGSKRIPYEFLTSDRTDRLQLLAGLVDSDGYCNMGKCYEIITKFDGLRDDILFLARSLGFGATCYKTQKSIKSIGFTGTYNRISINGDIRVVPVKLARKVGVDRKNKFNPLTCGFSIKEVGVEPYFGFSVDGPDQLFLLSDFTVVHNSTIIANVMKVFPGVQTVLAAPGVDLLGQLVEDMKKKLPGREIFGLFSGAKNKGQSCDITVTSLDSMHKVNPDTTQLLLIDEPHSAVSESRAPMLAKFKNARIYGFGATLSGRYDGADKLIHGLIGPVLARRTYREAVAEGAICPIKVWMVKLKFPRFPARDRNDAYRQAIFGNRNFNDLVKFISDNVIPKEFQTIIFAEEVKQIDLIQKFVPDAETAVACKMDKKSRQDLFDRMVRNEVKRCVATDIFSTGVTFPEVRCLVNAAAGGAGICSTQKSGRLAEQRPNKICGHVIDFLWECKDVSADEMEQINSDRDPWKWVVTDCLARMRVYEENGYDVQIVDDLNEVKII